MPAVLSGLWGLCPTNISCKTLILFQAIDESTLKDQANVKHWMSSLTVA